jgi:molybdate transport system ATP-binding protein
MSIQLAIRLARPGFTLDVNVSFPEAGVTALFGRSGAGKTTLLRILAGLEEAQGHVRLGDETYLDSAARVFVPAHRRGIGYVFQEPSLFPHLSVHANLDYAFKRRRRRPDGAHSAPAATGMDAVIATLGLRALLARAPGALSGGERQRVAIARALLASPRLLLMDEPLAGLDARSRSEIFPYLEQLRDGFHVPIVFVSHSLDELARLADHLVVMEQGRIRASGSMADVLSRLELSDMFSEDAGVIVDGVIGEHDSHDHLCRLDFASGSLWVPSEARAVGSGARARVLARDVSLALQAPGLSSILNTMPATVVELADAGPGRVTVRLSIGSAGTPLLARVTRRSCAVLDLRPGLSVFAQVKAVALLG